MVQYGEFSEVAFWLIQQSIQEAEIQARMSSFLDELAGC